MKITSAFLCYNVQDTTQIGQHSVIFTYANNEINTLLWTWFLAAIKLLIPAVTVAN